VSPIDGIHPVDVEVGDHRPALNGHVCLRWEVGLLYILQLRDQCLLRRTPRAGIPFDCALVHHDCERKTGVSFRLCHDQFGCLVDAVVRSVPVNDHTIDSAADHVGNLAMHLFPVGRTVTDIHVVRPSEPQQQVGIYLRRGAGIEQIANMDFADTAGTGVPIRLRRETGRYACVTCSLGG